MINLNNFFRIRYFCLLVAAALVISCSKSSEDDPGPPEPSEKDTNDLAIDPASTYQTIAGFGGASWMWGTQRIPTAADMKNAYGMEENELGFSIFRIRIASDPSQWTDFVNVSKEAQKYGAKILASPWSPPPALKGNGSDVGGHLPEENYGEFVDHLNAFVDFMDSNGVDIYAVSIQNEPDIQVSYESCDWSSGKMRDFIRDYGDSIEGVKIAAAESFNFNQSYTNVILTDEDAVENLDIVAGHIYGGGQALYPLAEQKGKEIWMTEYLMNQNSGVDPDNWDQSEAAIWEETLDMLETVHNAMANNWNAYIWWYLKRYYSFIGDGTQGTTSGEILKRGYAFSHFSKFIRPGYVRIDADLEESNALVTAYHGDGKTVIVMINTGTSPLADISISVGGSVPTSATRHETTLTNDRKVTVVEPNEDGKLLINLLGKSVVTVVIED